ncbi:hypothetical protein QFZ28_003354 [Neobacillus niacini]|nr:hypothetical protein [Neobacillus niacini]
MEDAQPITRKELLESLHEFQKGNIQLNQRIEMTVYLRRFGKLNNVLFRPLSKIHSKKTTYIPCRTPSNYLFNCSTFIGLVALLSLMISPIILMAISSVVSAPISNPIGE